jgi:hypothetical protein
MADTVLPFFKDCAFDPQATQLMGSAYEKACQAPNDIGQSDLVKSSRGGSSRRPKPASAM